MYSDENGIILTSPLNPLSYKERGDHIDCGYAQIPSPSGEGRVRGSISYCNLKVISLQGLILQTDKVFTFKYSISIDNSNKIIKL